MGGAAAPPNPPADFQNVCRDYSKGCESSLLRASPPFVEASLLRASNHPHPWNGPSKNLAWRGSGAPGRESATTQRRARSVAQTAHSSLARSAQLRAVPAGLLPLLRQVAAAFLPAGAQVRDRAPRPMQMMPVLQGMLTPRLGQSCRKREKHSVFPGFWRVRTWNISKPAWQAGLDDPGRARFWAGI